MSPIIFAVTNDLTYDQRMIRICSTLAGSGFRVLLVGRKMRGSLPLVKMPFEQKRLTLIFQKGFLFYAEFNLRLFFYLLFRRARIVCAIDLDTVAPCRLTSLIKSVPRAYDAHELFCEMKEIVTRPKVYRFWKMIEKIFVPAFKDGYTVNNLIATEFKNMYGLNYEVIRNMPLLEPLHIPDKPVRYILYQGAVNEGRSFETLIPAMQFVNAQLIICGDGNFMAQATKLVADNGLENKVIFTGKLSPIALRKYTLNAYIGVTLFDNIGLSNYYSLANRFFDYLHAALPQVCVDYPVYREIVSEHRVALLTDDLSAENLAKQINRLLADETLYKTLQQNCVLARETLNWQAEEKKLVAFYKKMSGTIG